MRFPLGSNDFNSDDYVDFKFLESTIHTIKPTSKIQ